jgi:tRNA(Ile)-lysidine synthase
VTANPAGECRADTVLHDGFALFDFTGKKTVVAAVSGGGDSTALLLLLKSHLDAGWPDIRLLAVTIDHGLRPGSRYEAEAVAALCGGIGVEHRILAWEGEKPATAVSAAAREARYRLLAQAAREAGTDVVFTGHTADDQAETVAMRSARGEGRGLAGMAPATLYENTIWIARPLLETSRAALRSYLDTLGTGWFEDPTNSNPAYERARVRAAGVHDETARGKRAAEERIALSRLAAQFMERHARIAAPGLLMLDGQFAHAPREAGAHALRILLAVTGGSEQLPDERRTEELFGRLSGKPFRATLSRAVIDLRPDCIFIHREYRGLPGAMPARHGLVWDGRFRLTIDERDPPILIAPIGRDRAAEADLSGVDAPAGLVRAALAAQPGLLDEGDASQRVSIGLGGGGGDARLVPLVAPWARFLPAFDLDAARAAAALIGALKIPAPPFRGHKGAKP